jgi:hypothetical protein
MGASAPGDGGKVVESRLARYAPLTGVLFVVLVAAGFLLSGDTPGANAPGSEVIDFYKDSMGKQVVATLLVTLGAVALLWFASSLRSILRTAEGGTGRISNIAFAGGLGSAFGFWVSAAIHFTLADVGGDVDAAAAQALNALDSDSFFAFAPGIAVLLLATALVARRTAILPAWLAWSAFVIFLASFTPAGFFAFILSGLWIIVVSVLLYRAQPAVGELRPTGQLI